MSAEPTNEKLEELLANALDLEHEGQQLLDELRNLTTVYDPEDAMATLSEAMFKADSIHKKTKELLREVGKLCPDQPSKGRSDASRPSRKRSS